MKRSKASAAMLAALFLTVFPIAGLAAEEDDGEAEEGCELSIVNTTSQGFQVFIDGQKVGKVEAGTVLVVEGVDYGTHKLLARSVDKRVKAETKVTINSPRFKWRLTGDDSSSDDDSGTEDDSGEED
jgi:hypothetical protein